jgi:hypothetical protein
LQRLGNNAIELGQDLHGQLRVDPLVPDQLVQGIRQGDAETRQTRSAKRPLSMVRADSRCGREQQIYLP